MSQQTLRIATGEELLLLSLWGNRHIRRSVEAELAYRALNGATGAQPRRQACGGARALPSARGAA